MRDNDFNLIRDPWTRVRRLDAAVEEVPMLDLFRNAHMYQVLAGELPTQDAAVLRLLLAVLHTVFSRVNADGEEDPLKDLTAKESLRRWHAIWELGQLPMEPIQAYLEQWEDRFWLFDDTHPFYQWTEARKLAGPNSDGVIKCKAMKLNASINQSANKDRIFVERARTEFTTLSYSEAARWLVHMVVCDDCAVKKSTDSKEKTAQARAKEQESSGVGWLGKLGIVYAEGDNLLETLMLNLVFWPNGEPGAAVQESPIWEQNQMPGAEREKLPWPDNLAELYTFLSRYVLLEREKGKVIGCDPVYGPFFVRYDSTAALEQMTRRNGNTNPKYSQFYPKPHDRGSFLWQEFDSLMVQGQQSDDTRPGVVRWIHTIQQKKNWIERHKLVKLHSVGIYYDGNKSSIEQIQTDQLDLHIDLLSNLGYAWRYLISEELHYAEQTAQLILMLSDNLQIAAHGSEVDQKGRPKRSDNRKKVADRDTARFYNVMDLSFRKWLRSISAEDTDQEEKRREWREMVRCKALSLGRSLADQAGPAAYVGHTFQVDDHPWIYTTAKAYGTFVAALHNLK